MADQPGADPNSAQPGATSTITSPERNTAPSAATDTQGSDFEEKAAGTPSEDRDTAPGASAPKSLDDYSEDELRAHPRLSQLIKEESNREIRRDMQRRDQENKAREAAEKAAEWRDTVRRAKDESDFESTEKVVGTVAEQLAQQERVGRTQAVAFEMAKQLRDHDIFKAVPEETFWSEMEKPTFGEFVASVVEHAYGSSHVPKKTVDSDYIHKDTVASDYVLRSELPEEFKAQRADERTRLMGEVPSPDLSPSVGGQRGRHIYTRDELRAMPISAFKEREREIEQQYAAGLIH